MQRMAGRSVSRRLALVGTALAAAAALTACGQAKPGVAAEIDGDILTVEEVQAVTAQFFEDFPEARGQVDTAELASVTVENFLRVRIVDAMGDEFDVQPSTGELEAYVDENFGGIEAVIPQMSGVGVPSSRLDLALDYLRFVYIENAVRQIKRDELGVEGDEPNDEVDLAVTALETQFSEAAEVAVNPRFGTWNGRTMASAAEAGSGSLSVIPGELGSPTAPAPGG